MDCDVIVMECDGLRCRWIVMDCDMEWLAVHTPIQTPLHADAPHPNHTMRALKPYRCARSKRRYTLKTALRAQNGAARSTGSARSNEVRQIGRLVRRGPQGYRRGVGRGSAD
jgi:hypothetical protein